MYKFSKKKKIIFGVIILIVLVVFSFYIYAGEDDSMFIGDNFIEDATESKNVNKEKSENTLEDNEKVIENNIIVHISGAVNAEGIVELKANSRISDAIEKAGGLREDADISLINLAYVLEDGMKIYIPSVNDKKNSDSVSSTEDTTNKENYNSSNIIANSVKNDETINYVTKESGGVNSGTVKNKENGTSSISNEKININKATQTELETLPGIGPSTALKIINYRNENGKFKSIDDIKNVSGIGDGKFTKIKDLICV